MITIYTDGGSRGNPGPAATGIVITLQDNRLIKTGSYLGIATNNVAEYSAVKEAFEYLLKNFSVNRGPVEFFLDSLLVASQLSGIYKIKDPTLAKFAASIKLFEKSWGKTCRYTHIPREKNKLADALVNEILDKNLS